MEKRKFINCLRKHLDHEKTEKQSQGSDKRLTAPLNPSIVPFVKHSVGKVILTRVWAGRKHFANWDVLHLDTSNSNGLAAALVCRTLTCRCKLTEQTIIRVRINFVQHTQCSQHDVDD